jgi:hypothetical protein
MGFAVVAAKVSLTRYQSTARRLAAAHVGKPLWLPAVDNKQRLQQVLSPHSFSGRHLANVLRDVR